MPHLGDVELAARLREERPDLPVVFISAYADSDLIREGMRLADVPFLRKPFSPEALAQLVRQTLGR